MDDMQAIEQRVTRELLRRAGPSEPVDDAAIFTAITATQSPKWRFQSMFSATKFVVAGAIVALFGGFLLAGVLTEPSEDRAPAAVTDSPEPTTELLPSVDLVTEEIEPGVERIVSDGIRDLSAVEPYVHRRLFAAPDGQVWLWTDTPDDIDGVAQGEPTLVKLGDPGSYAEGLGGGPEMRFAPDGTPLAFADLGSHSAIQRFAGSGWSTVHAAPWDSSDVGPDGVVWASGSFDVSDEPPFPLLRLDDSGWTEYPVDLDGLGLRPTLDAYLDTMEWSLDGEYAGPSIQGFRVDGQGAVWIELAHPFGGPGPMALVRFDGESWSLVDPLGVETYYGVNLLDIGSDGTLWVWLVTGRCDGGARPSPTADARSMVCHLRPADRDDELHYLARLTDDEWTVYSEEDGVVSLGDPLWRYGSLRVAPDGAVWVAPLDESLPLRSFDGETWRQYLEGHSVHDMAIAPDGKVWVLASTDERGPQHVYRIDPEAAAGTGS